MQCQPVSFAVAKINQRVAVPVLAMARALHFDNCAYVATCRTNWQRLHRRLTLSCIDALPIGALSIGVLCVDCGCAGGILERDCLQISRHALLLRNANREYSAQ